MAKTNIFISLSHAKTTSTIKKSCLNRRIERKKERKKERENLI